MSLGPEKIILILVVALIVFGPQRLPDIARQVGAAMRELRKMQDNVRGELEQVLHPDFTPPNSGIVSPNQIEQHNGTAPEIVGTEDTDHAALPPGTFSTGTNGSTANGANASNGTNGRTAPDFSGEYPTEYPPEDVTDDGFAGPRSFS